MAEATVIAVLGARPADSTALAAALASRLAFETGLHCDWLQAPADSALPAQALVRCRIDAAAPAAAGPPDPVALTLLLALDSPRHDPAAEARLRCDRRARAGGAEPDDQDLGAHLARTHRRWTGPARCFAHGR